MEQTQIISPWVFYWIDKVDDFRIISLFVLIIMLGIEVGTFLQLGEIFKPKMAIPVILISGLILLLTPSKETMYKMLIANEVTYEGAETIVKVIDEKVDALLDRIDRE